MGLLCYLLFYPAALAGGAARYASTRIFQTQRGIKYPHVIRPYKFSILNSPFSIVHCFGLRSVSLELLVLFFQEKRTNTTLNSLVLSRSNKKERENTS